MKAMGIYFHKRTPPSNLPPPKFHVEWTKWVDFTGMLLAIDFYGAEWQSGQGPAKGSGSWPLRHVFFSFLNRRPA